VPGDDRPLPDKHLAREGGAAVPRPAATVVVVRGGSSSLEVLLVQRTPEARFMAGYWVFPGGAVDADEDDPRRSGVRELREETGIELDGPDALVPFARWITPEEVAIRFDTLFFLAALPPGEDARADAAEIVDVRWLEPRAALDAYAAGELPMVFPTIHTLHELARHSTADAALAATRGSDMRPVRPRVITGDGPPRIVLPGEPGYEAG
jgi:8-oxo-dGTP pyrophosphatase MutT (NUDIX family)